MSKVLLKLMLLLFVSSTVATANQSKGVLSGQVIDAQTGFYLPGAVIKIEGTKFGAITDKLGKYTIVKAPEGEQVITVSYIGYMSQKDTISLADNVTKTLDFALSVGSVQADELVVMGDGLKGQSKALIHPSSEWELGLPASV